MWHILPTFWEWVIRTVSVECCISGFGQNMRLMLSEILQWNNQNFYDHSDLAVITYLFLPASVTWPNYQGYQRVRRNQVLYFQFHILNAFGWTRSIKPLPVVCHVMVVRPALICCRAFWIPLILVGTMEPWQNLHMLLGPSHKSCLDTKV